MNTVAGYVRVSTTDQTTGSQEHAIDELCKRRGWTFAECFRDHGRSGTEHPRHRPGFKAFYARRSQFQCLVVYRLDRLSRRMVDMVVTLDDLIAQGVGFATVAGPPVDTTSATGRLQFQLIGAFAEFERELIRERTIAGLERARAKGIIGGRRPSRDEATIRAVVAAHAAGTSYGRLSKEHGVPASTIKGWVKRAGLQTSPGEAAPSP